MLDMIFYFGGRTCMYILHKMLGVAKNPLAMGNEFIHFYEGNPINLHDPLLECFGRTQYMYTSTNI